MAQKHKGILTSIAVVLLLIILSITVAVIVTSISPDPWAGIGAAVMMFFLTGAIMIVMTIVGFVYYKKQESQYALGISIGMLVVIGFSLVVSFLISIYNFVIGLM